MLELRDKLSMGNCFVIFITTAVLSVLLVWMVIPAPPTGFNWDDTWYLLMAEFLSGRAEHQQLAWTMLQLRQYPPLFPFVLSLTGDLLINQQNAFVMNALFMALGAGVAMVWFFREGFLTVTSLIAVLLLIFNPVAMYWLPTLFSEHLFILLTTLALALASFRSDRFAVWIVVGVLVGLSVATRSAAWALVLGFLVFLLLDIKLKPLLGFLAGLVVGLLSIPYLKVGFPPSNTYLDRLVPTLTNMNLLYLEEQAWALLEGWQLLWGTAIGSVLAAALVVPGLGIRLRENRPDAWYILFYIAMLVMWPFPDHMSRFLWPLMPMFLIAAYSTVGLFKVRKNTSILVSLAMAAIFAFSIPGGAGNSVKRLIFPPPSEYYDLSRMSEWTSSTERQTGIDMLKTRRQFLIDMEKINRIADESSCIYSELPMMVTTHAKRAAYASLWPRLGHIITYQLKCPYYYLIPSALPHTTAADVADFKNYHKELFRSLAPYESEDQQILGIFFELQQMSAQIPSE